MAKRKDRTEGRIIQSSRSLVGRKKGKAMAMGWGVAMGGWHDATAQWVQKRPRPEGDK